MTTSLNSHRLFKFVLPLLMICFAQPKVFAQAGAASADQAQSSLRAGAWALQFQIADKILFRDFQGVGISGTHHFSDKKAIRLGIGIRIDFSDQDNDNSGSADYVKKKTQQVRDADFNSQGLDIVAQYISYPNPDAEVNFYLGAGPIIGFARTKSDGIRTDIIDDSTTSQYSYWSWENRWTIGGSAVFGAEWFATKRISFQGEYGISLVYMTAKQTSSAIYTRYSDQRESKTTNNFFRANLGLAKFGLSVYF